MPLSAESSALLQNLVLSPSSHLPLNLQAAAADVLLVRLIDEGKYVEALRLDARLDASSVGSASESVQDGTRRAVLIEKRKRLLQGVRALLPAVQRKLLDVEIGLDHEEDAAAEEEQGSESDKPEKELQMSWENVGGQQAVADADTSIKSATSSFRRGTPAKSRETSRPLSASPLLTHSPHNASDPQLAVLSAVVRSPLSPSASPRPSEARKQAQQQQRRDLASSNDAPSPLAGFLARNKPAQRSPSPLTPSRAQRQNVSAISPFAAPPNLPTATLPPGPLFYSGGAFDQSVRDDSSSAFFDQPVSERGSQLTAPPRKYEARFTDPLASLPPPLSASKANNWQQRAQSPAIPHRLRQSEVMRSPGGYGTDDSVMEDEVLPIGGRASAQSWASKQREAPSKRSPKKQASPPPAAAQANDDKPVRRRFGSPARSGRAKVAATPAKEVNQPPASQPAQAEDLADKTVPGLFPGLALADQEEDMQVDKPAAPSPAKAAGKKKASNLSPKKGRSSAAAVAASTPRRQTRQLTAELESQVGSDDEAPPADSLHAPVTSTPARKSRRGASKKTAEDLEAVSETGEEEDQVGELSVKRSTRKSTRSTLSTRRSSRLAASEDGDGDDTAQAAEPDTEKPTRRGVRRARG